MSYLYVIQQDIGTSDPVLESGWVEGLNLTTFVEKDGDNTTSGLEVYLILLPRWEPLMDGVVSRTELENPWVIHWDSFYEVGSKQSDVCSSGGRV